MVNIESGFEREEGVTFVRVTIENTRRTPQQVRLKSTLDGPVWAPGNPLVGAPEWEDRTWEGTIFPGRSRGVGFASPAAPPERAGADPVDVIDTKRVTTEEATDPRQVIAKLESWTPPSDAFADR